MSTPPLDDLGNVLPRSRTTLRLATAAVVIGGLAIAWIYSGKAWVFMRPVVHKDLINKYAGQYKFDPLWVMSIIKVESGFLSHAHSSRGAVGLMQLLPSTARELAPEVGLTGFRDEDLQRPDVNIRIGMHYLFKLQQLFPDDDVAVLAAWNAGPGITRQWRSGKPYLDMEDIQYPETRKFVSHVDRTFGYLKIIQGWKYLFGIAHPRHLQ